MCLPDCMQVGHDAAAAVAAARGGRRCVFRRLLRADELSVQQKTHKAVEVQR